MTCFKNQSNNYVECISAFSFLWCFLFGVIYLAIKGLWTHVAVVLILGVATGGFGLLSGWLIYPFFIKTLIKNKYLRQGWIEK